MLFSQGIAFPAIIPIVFSDFCLLCKPRYLPNVRENRIRFYQNLDYMEMLGIQPIQLIDDKTGIPISKIIYSYSRDLALQRSLGVSDLDLRTWELIFQTAVEDHREYLAQCKVFLIPIIDNR